ncbi:bifunctional phosphoserine phosphatase/homoserine phosphotransferase ThrH [Sediminicurvatus halobius]|uniref:phosphoserine phosphatase n=1 Tax=Sediminicurvatus halobius TaxID=2182432 RepID=A0A2U2N433_9GAMM|nr:bifunctional phosphoserine phosphatase/homoserine phosphotransferase ThrH [Spiribacter halobius]PWG63744.1 bifunctional phosphoserine phosphatase/homoserine phosphotransferase ThrH [Spiribacter halobius]UEX76225.1 bifunctional phosphoserine phosphatase/homoserine phosphotransferase ThrH [Spiribacter halobius]
MNIVCLDLEGVLVPEIWIEFAELTGIDALHATTRDIPDYDELMTMRLSELRRHRLGLPDIERVIARLEPMAGARRFLDGLRERYEVVILSDTFYEFARPLMRQLNRPTLFCHTLDVADDGTIRGYRLRLADHKRHAVRAFRGLNFRTVAAGDSYNDTGMLAEADAGVFFRPPQNVVEAFPDYPVTTDYPALEAAIGRGFGE